VDGAGSIVGGEDALGEIDDDWATSVDSGEDALFGLLEVVKLAEIALLRCASRGRVP
jgi:hypothetical protein